MSDARRRVITLEEYQSKIIAETELPPAVRLQLHDHYAKYVQIEPPFLPSAGWKLTALGYVGYLPLAKECAIALEPKVPIGNLFRMLETVYNFKFNIFAESFGAQTLTDAYQRLAHMLAQRVISRFRQGIYRAYTAHLDDLPYVRGRLDIQSLLRQPWRAQMPCRYEEHSADIEDNQLLLWTLHCILRSGLCTDAATRLAVRRAFHLLHGSTRLQPFPAQACLQRLYNRLNGDYQLLHSLCFFFLAHSGPHHRLGEQQMIPFLVDVAALFEAFVAKWLKNHLDSRYQVFDHEQHYLDADRQKMFDIDLVVRECAAARPLWVLDTKYKRPLSPSTNDIAQVVAYAETLGAKQAVLIYPSGSSAGATYQAGKITVRALCFDLAGNLDAAGERLMQALVAA